MDDHLGTAELTLLRTGRPNLLITGRPDRTAALLATLAPALPQPVYEWAPAGALPRRRGVGTILIRDVARLSAGEQLAWLNWLDGADQPRIVSTSTFPLFPLVEQGAFLAALYYRLNTVLLDVAEAG